MKLPVLSALQVIKVLIGQGFGISRQRGSHIVLIKTGGNVKLIVVVPNHREISPGTLLSIISKAGMTKDEFIALLD